MIVGQHSDYNLNVFFLVKLVDHDFNSIIRYILLTAKHCLVISLLSLSLSCEIRPKMPLKVAVQWTVFTYLVWKKCFETLRFLFRSSLSIATSNVAFSLRDLPANTGMHSDDNRLLMMILRKPYFDALEASQTRFGRDRQFKRLMSSTHWGAQSCQTGKLLR